MIVMTAVTSHAPISSAGDPSRRDISAGTMKMPDPIMEPITIAVAENNPMPCTNWGCAAVVTSACLEEIVTLQSFLSQMTKKVFQHLNATF